MRRRVGVRVLPVAALALVLGIVGLIVRQQRVRAVVGNPSACYSSLGLSSSLYPSGFAAGDFSSIYGAKINGNALQLDTNLTPLDPQHIILPFDQDVQVQYVYRNSGASHSIGWFYFDQVQPFLDANGELADNDNDGVPDFFQSKSAPSRPYDGLFHVTGANSVPDLFNSGLDWSDGGTYPHISNLLEKYMTSGGGMIFKIDDDDGDTSVQGPWGYTPEAPANDVMTTNDGIPDYDVNGDGIAGNEPDRTVDLGVIKGGREIVFFANFYYYFQLHGRNIGLTPPLGFPNAVRQPKPGGGGFDLQFTAQTDNSGGSPNRYLYWEFAAPPPRTIQSDDCLEYDTYLPTGSCVPGVGGLDIAFTDGSYMRDASGVPSYVDENGISGHPSSDLSSQACNSWYHRKLPLGTKAGDQTFYYDLVMENDTRNRTYTALYNNIAITSCSDDSLRQLIYSSIFPPSINRLDMVNDYSYQDPWYSGQTVPWFTKSILNPDFGAQPPGHVVQKTAIGCSRDDSGCYSPKGASLGWMDQGALDRLNTPTYNNLNISGDTTVVTEAADARGTVPHFIVAAPQSNPNVWLVAYDDQPEYPGATDADFNDMVFLVNRTNGGETVSNLVSTSLPSPDSMISKVRMTASGSFPGVCDSNARIDVYYSVDNKSTWNLMTSLTAADPNPDITVDVLGSHGGVGKQLYWKADFISDQQVCQPELTAFNMGYEALQHGTYKFSAPVPMGNLLYTGTIETPSSGWSVTAGDYSPRGHFFAEKLYDPSDPTTDTDTTLWDAGQRLATAAPNGRKLYTNNDGASLALSVSNLNTTMGPPNAQATLKEQILPTAVRSDKYNGKYVYDFTSYGTSVADDTDAQFVLEWTRGWEYPSDITFSPAATPQQRAWLLGPVHNSSPAIVGPPGQPAWRDGSATFLKTISSAFDAFQTANKTRATIAVVGAQDGMLHAFNAGSFRQGADADCSVPLLRGCFAGSPPDYGDGSEVWGFVPFTQLSQLKNNHPYVASYYPTANAHAEVDGSVSADDVWLDRLNGNAGGFTTAIFASLGRNQPYVTAVGLKVTGSATVPTTDPTQPFPLWATDWPAGIDAGGNPDPAFGYYNGSELSPAIAAASLPTAAGGGWLALVSSGLSSVAGPTYLFAIDVNTGMTFASGGKSGMVELNHGGVGGVGTPVYGIAGYPSAVDSSGDGLVDRVYTVDTGGNIYRVDTATMTACFIASTGESVFSGMSVSVLPSASEPQVTLYLGGGPNPDGTNPPAGGTTYHLFSYLDADGLGTCDSANHHKQYEFALGNGEKLWAAPVVAGDKVYWATSDADSEDVCASGTGRFFALPAVGNPDGTTGIIGTPSTLPAAAVSSINIFDGHAFVNSVNGTTTQIGGSGWNNAASGAASSKVKGFPTLFWQEQ